jgi:hypothetical protein
MRVTIVHAACSSGLCSRRCCVWWLNKHLCCVALKYSPSPQYKWVYSNWTIRRLNDESQSARNTGGRSALQFEKKTYALFTKAKWTGCFASMIDLGRLNAVWRDVPSCEPSISKIKGCKRMTSIIVYQIYMLIISAPYYTYRSIGMSQF